MNEMNDLKIGMSEKTEKSFEKRARGHRREMDCVGQFDADDGREDREKFCKESTRAWERDGLDAEVQYKCCWKLLTVSLFK